MARSNKQLSRSRTGTAILIGGGLVILGATANYLVQLAEAGENLSIGFSDFGKLNFSQGILTGEIGLLFSNPGKVNLTLQQTDLTVFVAGQEIGVINQRGLRRAIEANRQLVRQTFQFSVPVFQAGLNLVAGLFSGGNPLRVRLKGRVRVSGFPQDIDDTYEYFPKKKQQK
ncbi:MAG: LEA type 2 family protein [Bacteroidia bacterium]|nr:LEA type 2 family protein [Bacteroidia bacterium]